MSAAEADYLLKNELLNNILEAIEREAVESCIDALPLDDETRRISAFEVRAIRSLRRKLKAVLTAKTSPTIQGSVV